ncbi:MAG TPA: CPBP family glutamic-type intramembrane protease [Acidimicrobiales bacterium]|nr:CPBP family glutamic-type intramembrane protease [Acidimicrobiales bacterium]
MAFTLLFLLVGAPLIEELFFRWPASAFPRVALRATGGHQHPGRVVRNGPCERATEAVNVVIFAATAMAGVVLGISVWRYHRLGPGILAHGLFNLVPAVLMVFG